MANLRFNYSKW